MKSISLLAAILLIQRCLFGQTTIEDPCFLSMDEFGFFTASKSIQNLCFCPDSYLASDFMQWDGSQWVGAHPNSEVDLPPPKSCGQRAFWMSQWTGNGEGVALKLTEPITEGNVYSFTFTYASDGRRSEGAFAPKISTMRTNYDKYSTHFIGRLPPASDWRTETFSFTASHSQDGDRWLVVYIDNDSGILLSDCLGEHPLKDRELFEFQDTTICAGTPFSLSLPQGNNYQYIWSTGETTSSISPATEGKIVATIGYLDCEVSDSLTLAIEDCEVRISFPNFFSPNQIDDYNPVFVPHQYNYIESGSIVIYNRWGQLVFSGDLFEGWDGTKDGHPMPMGVYYFVAQYIDRNKNKYDKKGSLTLMR